jgi:hypothetical protein
MYLHTLVSVQGVGTNSDFTSFLGADQGGHSGMTAFDWNYRTGGSRFGDLTSPDSRYTRHTVLTIHCTHYLTSPDSSSSRSRDKERRASGKPKQKTISEHTEDAATL